jgi:hypothetical protein
LFNKMVRFPYPILVLSSHVMFAVLLFTIYLLMCVFKLHPTKNREVHSRQQTQTDPFFTKLVTLFASSVDLSI